MIGPTDLLQPSPAPHFKTFHASSFISGSKIDDGDDNTVGDIDNDQSDFGNEIIVINTVVVKMIVECSARVPVKYRYIRNVCNSCVETGFSQTFPLHLLGLPDCDVTSQATVFCIACSSRILRVALLQYLREASSKVGEVDRTYDVLLTVHLSIILVINQLDAQNLVLQ